MISYRKAALLGLTAPLSAIMIAVIGLWPEPDEPIIQPQPVFLGGGSKGRRFSFDAFDDIDKKRAQVNMKFMLLTAAALAEIL